MHYLILGNLTIKNLNPLFYVNPKKQMHCNQGGRGHGLFITLVPKILEYRFIFVSFTSLGTFLLICLFFKMSVQTFLPLFVIYKSGNFVYHHWGFT